MCVCVWIEDWIQKYIIIYRIFILPGLAWEKKNQKSNQILLIEQQNEKAFLSDQDQVHIHLKQTSQ